MLVKVIGFFQPFLDTPNHKFDEMLRIFEDILKTIEVKAPNVDAYENLTNILNVSFQKVF